jgi:hypothetical protein
MLADRMMQPLEPVPLTTLADHILQPLGTRTQRSCSGFLWVLSILPHDALSSTLVPENGSFPSQGAGEGFPMVHSGLWVCVSNDHAPVLYMALLSACIDCALQSLGTRTQRLCPDFLWALPISVQRALSSALLI